jgi:hypothetical protein
MLPSTSRKSLASSDRGNINEANQLKTLLDFRPLGIIRSICLAKSEIRFFAQISCYVLWLKKLLELYAYLIRQRRAMFGMVVGPWEDCLCVLWSFWTIKRSPTNMLLFWHANWRHIAKDETSSRTDIACVYEPHVNSLQTGARSRCRKMHNNRCLFCSQFTVSFAYSQRATKTSLSASYTIY